MTEDIENAIPVKNSKRNKLIIDFALFLLAVLGIVIVYNMQSTDSPKTEIEVLLPSLCVKSTMNKCLCPDG